jgi:hypothetical protein
MPAAAWCEMLAEGFQFREVLQMTSMHHLDPRASEIGSLDGDGAGDHDLPYRFGRRPTSQIPFPFNTRQYVRLLVLRSRVEQRTYLADHKA